MLALQRRQTKMRRKSSSLLLKLKVYFYQGFCVCLLQRDSGPTVSQVRLSTLIELNFQLCLRYGPPLPSR